MNSFLNSVPGMLQNMMPRPMQNMMSIIQYAQQIRQNPAMLANILQERGMIDKQQLKDVQGMGGNFEQIGQYLIQNGKMPSNVQQYEGQVNQVQNYLNRK
jgi:hypothetical protein